MKKTILGSNTITPKEYGRYMGAMFSDINPSGALIGGAIFCWLCNTPIE